PTSPEPAVGSSEQGTVEVRSIAPRLVKLKVTARQPSILLVVDKHSPDVRAVVDTRPVLLRRCNFIMQGVFVDAGQHEVELFYAGRWGHIGLEGLALVALISAIGGVVIESCRLDRVAMESNPEQAR
ncbi:MAG: hypothetical protein ACUVWX_06835, partial [Kiritimatiellia bacterium]